MYKPEEIRIVSKDFEESNVKFRRWLKNHADAVDLDHKLKELHKTIFRGYDCNSCRNCCKIFGATFTDKDIEHAAEHLHMTKVEFLKEHLELSQGEYISKSLPCHFVTPEGACALESDQPLGCRDFPYTNQPYRMGSLINLMTIASICPPVFEMVECLKRMYGFKN